VALAGAAAGAGAVADAAPLYTRPGFWGRLRKDRAALAGGTIVGFVVLCAVFAGLVSNDILHHGLNQVFGTRTLNGYGLPDGPSSAFPFGADLQGRDLLVRVLYGARTSLLIGGLGTALALLIGVSLGTIGGYFGGPIDTFVARITDIVLALPLLLIAIGLDASCGTTAQGCLGGALKPGVSLVVLVVTLFSWPYIARVIRGNVLSLREEEFVEAARAAGYGHGRIIVSEILPNLAGPIIVLATLQIPSNIMFEAVLSFLGVGVPDTTPSWGAMLHDASGVFTVAWWLMVFPGLALALTTLGFYLLGDGLRDALDARSGLR
jgi:peptide/nickel transport system permease protein